MESADRRLILGAVGLAGAAALANLAKAGPLDPPAGPISSSGKTLKEVEPRIAITPVPGQLVNIPGPGSYYLTADADNGIRVGSPDVSIDLNGFCVRRGSQGAAIRQGEATFANRLQVRNGRIDLATGGGAVSLDFANNDGLVLEDLVVALGSGSSLQGVTGSAPNATVRRCTFSATGSGTLFSPLALGAGSVLENCLFQNCGNAPTLGSNSAIADCVFLGTGITLSNEGMVVGDTCSIRRCTFFLYRTALLTGSACSVEDCLFNNSNTAIGVGAYSSVLRNTIDFFTDAGVVAGGDRISVLDNRITRGPSGVKLFISARATVARNTFSGVTTPVSGADASSAVGPLVTPANIGSATNPWANVNVA
jgi:hypothetical protein